MARPPKTKSKITAPNGTKIHPVSLALPSPPPNPGLDLLELRDEVGVKSFASQYMSAEELEYLKAAVKGKVLTPDEKIAILEMSIAGLEPSIIGVRIGRDPGTVRSFLSRYRPRNTVARAYIEANSEKLAKRVVKNATVEESLEVLHRINVLPKPAVAGPATNTQFNIVVGSTAGGPTFPSQAEINAAASKEK